MDDFANKRYRLEQELGKGGMGIVYRATDRLTGQQVALKRVTTSTEALAMLSTSNSITGRLALAEEFQTLASLWHPNIISVLDYGFDAENQPYFTMDLLENSVTVTTYAKNLSPQEKVNTLWQILQALKYLHRRGILHRDLKPANILVSAQQLKVLDFGLAIVRGKDYTGSTTTSGTLAYMAPEVLLGAPIGEYSDLYAVGVIAYEMFTGKHPFHFGDMAKLVDDILYTEPDLAAFAELQLKIAPIILRLMAKTPENRFSSADEVLIALKDLPEQTFVMETQATRESYLQASQFVGRSDELNKLIDLLAQVEQKQGGLWLIGGESGVGKSRLVSELRTQALVRGMLVVRGQEISEGGTLYQLWRDILKLMSLFTSLSDSEAAVLKTIIPEIDGLLERSIPDAPTLPPQAAQQRLLAVITGLFKRQQDPLLVILEDIQWSAESLDVLKQIIPELAKLPILIFATYRNDDRPDLPKLLPGSNAIQLNRLSQGDIALLSESMIGASGRSPEVIELLQRETEGNVFFVVEVVRALAEEVGQLDKIGEASLPAQVFAGGIRKIVQRRLNRVSAEDYALLQIAAVLGRRIDETLIRAAAPTKNVDQWLVNCANAAVISIADENWGFSHDKLREALLSDLSADQQKPLHRQVAELIEAIHPEQASKLAYHWQMAGNPEKELRYSMLAAKEAHRNGVLSEAIRHYKRSIELVMQQPETPERTAEELTLQLELGANLLAAKGYGSDEVFETYERARQLCQQIGNTPRYFAVISGLNVYYVVRAKIKTAFELAEQAVKLAEIAQDSALFVEAYRMMAAATFWGGDFVQSDVYMKKTYDTYDPISHRANIITYGQDTAVTVLTNGGWLRWFLGYPDQALATSLKGLNLAKEVGHMFSLCFAQSFVNNLYIALDDIEALRQGSEVLSQVTAEHGIRGYVPHSFMHRGAYLSAIGKHEEGIALMQQALQIFRSAGSELNKMFLHVLIANAYHALGKYDEGLNSIQEAFDLMASNESRAVVPEMYRMKGKLLLDRSVASRDEAIQAFRQALELARKMSAKSLELRAVMNLYQAGVDNARSDLANVYQWFTEGLETPDLRTARRLLE